MRVFRESFKGFNLHPPGHFNRLNLSPVSHMNNYLLVSLGSLLIASVAPGQTLDIWFDSESDRVAPGEHLTQRIWVMNPGETTASAVSLEYTAHEYTRTWGGYVYPAGVLPNGYIDDGETVSLALGDIPGGAVRLVTIPVEILGQAVVGEMIDWQIDSNYSDPQTVSTPVGATDKLQVAITTDFQALKPGETALVTLHVANPSGSGVSRAELQVEWDSDLEAVSSSFPAGSVNGNTAAVSLGTIPGQSLQQYVLKVRLKEGVQVPALKRLSASVGGRIDEAFGAATLVLLAIDAIPARTVAVSDWAYRLTTHNLAGSRLEDARLLSHIPQEGQVWNGYVQPLAQNNSGYRDSTDFPLHWELPDIFAGDAFFAQIPLTHEDATFARVQRNELVLEDLVLPADAPFVRSQRFGGPLSLELTAPDPVEPGDAFVVEYRYGNPGEANTDAARLLFHLPALVSISDASATYENLGEGMYEAEIGELRPGETGSFRLHLQTVSAAPESHQYDFSAWISDESFPVNTAFDRLVVQAYTDFPITFKFNTAKQLLRDGFLAQTDLEITNRDPFPLTDVRVSVSVPAGMQFWRGYAVPDPTSGNSGYLDYADPVIWEIPVLEAGRTQTISMPWNLETIPGWWYTLNAVVTTTEGFNARTQALLTANDGSDLSLFMQADSPLVSPGDTAWITVTYTNPGDASSLNPTLSLVLPEGVNFIRSDVEPVQTDPVVRYNFSSMNPGDRGRVRVEVEFENTLPVGENPAIYGEIRDENVPGNFAVAEAGFRLEDSPPLELQVTGHGDPASGQTRQVEVLLGNTSDDLLEDIRISLIIPSFHRVDPDLIQPYGGSGGNRTVGEDYVYMLDALPPGEPFLLTLPFDTDNADRGWISEITVHALSAEGYHARDSEHVVYRTGTLNVEMTPLVDYAVPGDVLPYRVYVGNSAEVDRENVVLNVSLPEACTFSYASGGGAVFAGEILWELGTIPPGSIAYVDFGVAPDVALPEGRILQNEAFVTDSESPRNTARAVTSIPVSDGQPTLSLGVALEEGVMTHTVINNTGQELASLRFWYTMPEGLVLSTDTRIGARDPVFRDLANVVSEEPQDLESPLQTVGGVPAGHIAPVTAGALSNQGYGAVRRSVAPITQNLYAVTTDGLPPELRQMWTDAERHDGGWVRSAWYGWFLDEDWPWIIHAEHGYQFPVNSNFGLYLYDFPLKTWFFVTRAAYFNDPNFATFHLYHDSEWIPVGFYRGGVSPNRWFFHYGPEYDRAMNEGELRALLEE